MLVSLTKLMNSSVMSNRNDNRIHRIGGYGSNHDQILKDADLNNQEMFLLTWDRLGLKMTTSVFKTGVG